MLIAITGCGKTNIENMDVAAAAQGNDITEKENMAIEGMYYKINSDDADWLQQMLSPMSTDNRV